jgi:hypothetical protein
MSANEFAARGGTRRRPPIRESRVGRHEVIATNASAADRVSTGVGHQPSERPAVTYRLLGSKGFRPDEAGNLTAYLHGIPPVRSGWALHEIEGLLFLRDLVERGRIGS